ncbi:MAG: hypothetical protein WDZ59_04000 [Pirellulales bacterium]
MEYRSVDDLNHVLRERLYLVPRDVDLIVGIPRSGLLAANLLALHLNLPLADLDGYLEGRVLYTGRTRRGIVERRVADQPRKVLILDDSSRTGAEIRAARERVAAAAMPGEHLYAAVYACTETLGEVDIHFELCDPPRVFEWNVMHHGFLKRSCLDIDGVLCADPTDEENDDGPCYSRFLEQATPRFLPTAPVGWLVTSRLEKYRAATEAWLARHGVNYGELLMMDYPDMAARRAAGQYCRFKADAYIRTRAMLFIESSHLLAEGISRLAGKPVLCIETGKIVNPNLVDRAKHRSRDLLFRIRCRVRMFVGRFQRVGEQTPPSG